jgi:hypothetical protein
VSPPLPEPTTSTSTVSSRSLIDSSRYLDPHPASRP